MSAPPNRQVCRICARRIAVDRNGNLRWHLRRGRGSEACSGAMQPYEGAWRDRP